MIVKDLSSVEMLGPGEIKHETKYLIDTGPEIDHVRAIREANIFRKGFSDDRTMKFRAQIPAEIVWYYEHVLGWDFRDKRDFRRFLADHPEYLVSPEDTGRSGHIIVKGS